MGAGVQRWWRADPAIERRQWCIEQRGLLHAAIVRTPSAKLASLRPWVRAIGSLNAHIFIEEASRG